jgi:GNAT superfamily N-acetyltransferase
MTLLQHMLLPSMRLVQERPRPWMAMLTGNSRLESGEIVGVAKWNFYDDTASQFPFADVHPPNANIPFLEFFFGSMNNERNEKMKGKRQVLMSLLAIDPAYQRMGIGGKLLDWGLAKCDSEGRDCWIDATKEGKGLYEKFGWKEVSVITLELEKWGGPKGSVYYNTCMLRPAQPVKRGS